MTPMFSFHSGLNLASLKPSHPAMGEHSEGPPPMPVSERKRTAAPRPPLAPLEKKARPAEPPPIKLMTASAKGSAPLPPASMVSPPPRAPKHGTAASAIGARSVKQEDGPATVAAAKASLPKETTAAAEAQQHGGHMAKPPNAPAARTTPATAGNQPANASSAAATSSQPAAGGSTKTESPAEVSPKVEVPDPGVKVEGVSDTPVPQQGGAWGVYGSVPSPGVQCGFHRPTVSPQLGNMGAQFSPATPLMQTVHFAQMPAGQVPTIMPSGLPAMMPGPMQFGVPPVAPMVQPVSQAQVAAAAAAAAEAPAAQASSAAGTFTSLPGHGVWRPGCPSGQQKGERQGKGKGHVHNSAQIRRESAQREKIIRESYESQMQAQQDNFDIRMESLSTTYEARVETLRAELVTVRARLALAENMLRQNGLLP